MGFLGIVMEGLHHFVDAIFLSTRSAFRIIRQVSLRKYIFFMLAGFFLSLTSCDYYLEASLEDLNLSSSKIVVKVSSPKGLYVNQPVTLDLEFSVKPKDFKLSDLTVTNGELSNLQITSTGAQVQLTPRSEGIVQIRGTNMVFTTQNLELITKSRLEELTDTTFEMYYDVTPPTITGVVRDSPLLSPSKQKSVQVKVLGMQAGEYVEIFSDASCATNKVVGSATAQDTSALVDIDIFVSGVYHFYAQARDLAGNVSSCTASYATYELDIIPPSLLTLSLALQNPSTSPGVNKRPIIRLSGLSEVKSVYLFTDSNCSNLYGSAFVAEGDTEIDISGTSDLVEGIYQFHARLGDDLQNVSDCSTASVQYELEIVLPTVIMATTLTSPVSASLITYTLSFSEEPVNFALEDITVTNGIAQNLKGTGTNRSFEVVPVADGMVSVLIQAGTFTNAAGDANTESNRIDLDYKKPIWRQDAYIKAANANSNDYFGYSVAISGDTVVVGAYGEDSNQTVITNGPTASADDSMSRAGAVYVYRRSGVNWLQEAYIKAVNAGVDDYFGSSVAISGDTVVVGAIEEDSNQTVITNGPTASADDSSSSSGAVYVYRRSGVNWSQEAYIKAVNVGTYDQFGNSVAISADTLVVGSYEESSNQTVITNGSSASADDSSSSSGAVYVYRRSGVNWSQEAYIKAANADDSDQFGNSVAISGDTVVVGAPYEDSNEIVITNGASASADNSLSNSGAVYVYRRSGVNWSQEAYIKAVNAGGSDFFGYSVAISGDTVVVGAYCESSNQTVITNGASASADNSLSNSGAVYVYRRSGVNWLQEAYIKASNAGSSDYFGYSVAISGETAVVGAYGESSNQTVITNGTSASADNSMSRAGAVYVYRRSGVNWSQEAYIKAANADNDDQFGNSVAISDDTVLVGAHKEESNQIVITNGATASADNSLSNSGAAYVYSRAGAKAVLNGGVFGEASSATSLNLSVGGLDIARYKYKIGPAGSTDCSDSSGYSGFIDKSIAITNNLSGYADGELVLCVIGETTEGLLQSVSQATEMRWVKDTLPPTAPANVVDGVTTWDKGYESPPFNWTASTDVTSAIAYEVSLGSTPGAEDYVGWMGIAQNEVPWVSKHLPSSYGATVYLNVRARDRAGNVSAVASSDGYTVENCNPADGWCPSAYIKTANADTGDIFGDNVAISGDTLVVGAIGEDSNQTVITNGTTASADNSSINSGAVYVYRRSGVNWSQEAYIKAANTGSNDNFGSSVAISGDTVVVGAIGEDSNQTVITNGASASANNSLSSSGAVYVYRRSGVNWSQEAYIKAANTGSYDEFGSSVAISGDTVVVGADEEDSNQTVITNGASASANNSLSSSGAVYVYRRSGVNWSQEAYIKAANTGSNDNFGYSVAISGETAVVGAYGESSNQTVITNGASASADNSLSSSGAVYVYRRSGVNWSQEAYIKAANANIYDRFGSRVAISGDTVVVGVLHEDSNQTVITNGASASANNSLSDSGAVYVYRRSGVNWSQEAYIKAANAGASDWFGYRVAISGDTIVAGTGAEDSNQTVITNGASASANNSMSNSGAVYVYRRSGVNWSQEAYIKAANAGASDWFGCSVALSGDTVVVGANGEASNQTVITNGASASADNSLLNSGAVYIYQYGPGVVITNDFTQVDIDYSHLRAGQNTTVLVEYSDDNSLWTTTKSQVLIPNSRNTYTIAWDSKGAHRYWRLRFVDPDDSVIGGADELFEVSFHRLNGFIISPSIATGLGSSFTSATNAQDKNSGTAAVWDGSATGVISWDFGP